MSDDNEWGPWIEHDGNGCPCKGMFVHVVFQDEHEWECIAGSFGGQSWDWTTGCTRIVRYRIRKPRGLTILEDLLENLPESVDA